MSSLCRPKYIATVKRPQVDLKYGKVSEHFHNHHFYSISLFLIPCFIKAKTWYSSKYHESRIILITWWSDQRKKIINRSSWSVFRPNREVRCTEYCALAHIYLQRSASERPIAAFWHAIILKLLKSESGFQLREALNLP